MIKAQEVIEGTGKVTVDSYVDELIEQGVTTEGEVTDNGDGTKTVITDEGYVVLIKPNPDNIDNDIIIEIEGKADNLPVKIEEIKLTESSNSIEVKVIVKRAEGATYKYWYREGEGEYKLAHDGEETTYKIEGLKSDTRYVIKVEATNKSGTVYKEEVGYTGVITPAQGAITFGNLSWSNGKASTTVTKTTSDSYKIEYQVTNSSGAVTVEYKEIASGGTIGNLDLGDLVTVRLTDGINHGSTASLNVTDITAPSVTVEKRTVTSNSIQVNVTAVDEQAGMPSSPSYKYYIKKTVDANYPTTPTKTQTSTSYTFTGLAQNTSYDVKVEVSDEAGNEGIGEIKGVATLIGMPAGWNPDKVDVIDDGKGKKVPLPKGFYYVGGDIDTGIVISDNAEDKNGGTSYEQASRLKGNQFVWIPVSSEADLERTKFDNTGKPTSGLTAAHTEPYNDGYPTEAKEYNTMKTQVLKYGGFYIGRYEAGVNSTTLRRDPTPAQKIVVKKGVAPYNYVPWGKKNNDASEIEGQSGAVYLAKNFATQEKYTSVTSTLCYGSQWDAMCRYIGDSYRSTSQKDAPELTGSVSTDVSKNIYDLAGNCYEWTMEARDSYRVLRGGRYSNGAPVLSRGYTTTTVYKENAFRCTLYIN